MKTAAIANTARKTLLAAVTLATTLSALPGTAHASGYQCYRPAVAAGWVKNRIPKGNWSPFHNTNNWSYDAVPGGDIYRHRKGRRTVGTRCKGPGYDYGTLKIDFVGYQDWCVSYNPGQAASTTSPGCPTGHALDASGATCTRPAQPGRWQKTRKPGGNWNPVHNTNNWSYDAVPGGDIYRHRKGRRTVGTMCQRFDFNHGTLKIDFEGYQDWCTKWIAPVAASTVQAQCPSGFSLQQGGITGSVGGTISGVSGSFKSFSPGIARPALGRPAIALTPAPKY
jgi:hypothetical protein